ncbi:16S rRNA (guanine(527)-N(7))-methyltransferase RsmG [Pseudogracilibacillus sp. ICA-222130]|uniref:16S rRNA (guanine(527)-N(7))-methyltransferase RsmG n=1 Tax=Pseudogracilibacillus sp. ICA-222130 TaxID=3134655 RepID=UPI0030BCCA42
MNLDTFITALQEHHIHLNETQIAQFETYFEELVAWNEKVNLTAITEKEEVYVKHFYDSISPSFYFDFNEVQTICDVGAGAGFPSIPLKICFPHLQVTIVDSLKKRINFLEHLSNSLKLENTTFVHARAEDFGQHKDFRESFDVVTARAVARMSVLSELCLPLTKVNGVFLALKGASAAEELAEGKKAIKVLGGEVVKMDTFSLPVEDSERTIYTIKKVKNTHKKYPRKAGTPAKSPIS